MRKMLIGGFLVVALLMGALSCASAPTEEAQFSGGPRISFGEDSVELGEIPSGVQIDYTFRFKNVGDEPLIITDARTKAIVGCCPPQPVVDSKTLQPGEESTLLIKDTAHPGGGMHKGPHEFEITVKSNDPVEPEKKLYLMVDFPPSDED